MVQCLPKEKNKEIKGIANYCVNTFNFIAMIRIYMFHVTLIPLVLTLVLQSLIKILIH